MNKYTDLTDDDLRLVLQRMDEHDTPPLPQDLTDRVMERLQLVSTDPLKGEGYRRALLLPSGRLGGGRRGVLWAVAASIALIVAITLTLWPKPQQTVYRDTFASAEEACLVLSNNTDHNTIAL